MEIKYSILPKQKNRRHSLDVKINLYNYASELYSELDNISIINRINEVPQLGALKVKKKFSKSKFDYIMLLSNVRLFKDSLVKIIGDVFDCYDSLINLFGGQCQII